MHIKILQTIFTFVCIIIFGYFSYQSLSEYFAYKTVSKQNLDRQESQLMPRICFSSRALAEKKLRKLGISLDEYTYEGIWTSNLVNYSTTREYEIKQLVFPHLTDILCKVKIKSRINNDSDKYKTTYYKSTELLNQTDIQVVQLGYYYDFSIFCFGFPKSSFPFGIEKVYFSMKHDCEVHVVAPGNFYTFERKRNFMHILSSHNYLYQV